MSGKTRCACETFVKRLLNIVYKLSILASGEDLVALCIINGAKKRRTEF